MKEKTKFKCAGQHSVSNEKTGIIADKIIYFSSNHTSPLYPDKIRMVVYKDKITQKIYTFITNNFKLAASTIAEIYKQRWQIELFFK